VREAARKGARARRDGERRAVEEEAVERFIECGDPHYGFARIYCDACGHDDLLAYSCKRRYFCPSCHQRRVLLYGEWVEEKVLEPVAHRQYVFSVPRLLRPLFGRHRAWLGELCRIAARLLVEAYAEAAPGARPGLLLFVQTFGDRANFNPHVHVLAADGGFGADGTLNRAAAGARRPACRRVSACAARVSGQGAGDPGRVAIALARLAALRRVLGA
jgi:hypothetical protein